LPADYPLDGNAECRSCHREFTPRKGTGGKPQVYCSAECRREADAERKANPTQREQRAPQRAASPAPAPLKNEFALVAPETNGKSFDWIDDRNAVLLSEQRAVAAYFNADDDLVIRQERSWCDDEDQIVVIHKDNIAAFIDKLTDICGIPSVGK
jgi:hypothetical protein